MASLRKGKVKQGGKTYTYWVVDYTYTKNGERKRKKRNFKEKAEAGLFRAEIERKLARARHGELEVDMGPAKVGITEWLDRFAGVLPKI